MKLLFDQNISFRILKKIKEYFPESAQVRRERLEDSSDLQIWNHAKSKNYTIVTFDNDFCDISILKGMPPRVILITAGNLNTEELAELIIKKSDLITEFVQSEETLEWAISELM